MRRPVILLGFALLAAAIPGAAQPTLPQMVAAGDVTTDSAVLWARVSSKGPVLFYIAGLGTPPPPIRTARAVVKDPAVPAKVEISGLYDGTEYEYVVFAPSGESRRGTFRTAAAAGRRGLHFGVSGDEGGHLAPFPSVRNAASRGLDFFVSLGDTVYADVPSPAVPSGSASTLAEFRAKHAEVYATIHGLNALGELRSSTAIYTTLDDHEVANDFAGGAPPGSDPRFSSFPGAFINETQLYRDGLRAFHEYNPIRTEAYPLSADARSSGKPRLYRYRTFGEDAAIFLLDARSFRDTELVGANPSSSSDILRFLLQSFDLTPAPSRTLLGAAQLAALKSDLLDAQARGITWKFVMVPVPIQNLGIVRAADRYEGYARERTELLSFVGANAIDNVVFLTADLHGVVVNNLKYQLGPGQPQVPTNTFEVVTGPVASSPIGPAFVGLALSAGFISPAQKAFYDSLPVLYDPDSALNDKDDFVKALLNQQLAPFGYDPVGLAGSPVTAALESGDYLAAHAYGWTELEIDAVTQRLTVTTWGIPWYSAAQMTADPDAVASQTPSVISRFHADPQ